MESKLNEVCMELNAFKLISNLLQKELISIPSNLTSRDVKHLTNKVLNEVTAPNREWSTMVHKSSHGFMKPAKTILPHAVQPILILNRYSELANLQSFSSACESLDNPGDKTSTVTSSEHLNTVTRDF